MYNNPKYLLAGDKAIIIEFGNEINKEINNCVRNMYLAIKKYNIKGIVETIPTYRSILIEYDPLTINIKDLKNKLYQVQSKMNDIQIPEPRLIEIPTVYGGKYGPDLKFVAKYNNITEKDVIKIHTSVDYLIYMLGFTPGFTYLGGMSDKIETPRLETPRLKIPAGSVGIAGKQTGIYPIESPGGWQLIGRTPIKIYDSLRKNPIMLKAGDYLRFVPITEKEYEDILQVENYYENKEDKEGR
ncbi:kinase A inhibitor [Clostridium acetireducens DSM 10703]|jgi:inhibitor of KinA|uniref:Kinase A inhibitor n=1 Tax=Clostridium acetireducens DSM 10703 TaxID=1121290 RepID=A0A1E8F1C0_9CLOT|nr:5-oxoprolinase subunit PxpB [Clostridium acetireducens]OFI06959.1 kinase A inhibitor [Clostridium acetireducens DSM 10703]